MSVYLGENKVSLLGGQPVIINDDTVLESLNVTPSSTTQNFSPSASIDGWNSVTVNPIPNEYIIPSGSLTITSNGTTDITDKASVIVNVQPNLQSKNTTPTENQQTISPDSAYDGLSSVTVGAISNTYIGSGITQNPTLTANGATVTVPAGYYSAQTEKSVNTAIQATPSVTINTSTGVVTATATQRAGYVVAGTETETLELSTQAAATITPSTSSQIAVAANKYTTGAVTVTAIPSEYIIPSGSVTITANGTSDVTDKASVVVNVQPSLQSKTVTPTENEQIISADTNYDGLSSVTVGAISSSYIGSGITQRDNTDLSASGATVTVPAGYYAENETKSVTTTTHPNPTAEINSSTGLVTASHTQTAGYVSAGTTTGTLQLTAKAATTYNTSTTDQTIASDQYLTGAQTIKAVTTTNLTAANVAAGITIKVGDENDDDRIAGVTGTYTSDATAAASVINSGETAYVNGVKITGTQVVQHYYTGSSAPSSSLGSDGDIYLQV